MSLWVPTTLCNEFSCEDNDGTMTGFWLRLAMLVFGGIFLTIELMQMYILTWSYFDDFWNYLYVGSIVLNVLVVLEHSMQVADLTYDSLQAVNAVAVVVQWGMLYYWMRLFPSLAFFVTFLVEVVKDIGPFISMFFICIFMFGNAIFVLNKSIMDVRHVHNYQEGEDTSVNPHHDNPIITE
jgi:hypothetical protein